MRETFKARIIGWRQQIDALQTRERVMVFVMVAAVLFFALQWLLLEPVLKSNAQMTRQQQQLQDQQQQKKSEKQQLEMILAVGVNKAKLVQRDKLNTDLLRLDKSIQASLLTLIPPKLMPQVLEKVLAENTQLKLLSLENKPVVILIDEQQASKQGPQRSANSESDNKQGLYKHGFILRLEGSYPAAIDYFEALSQLPWRFNWDAMHYEVTSYPKANITLEVHTVSLSPDWIGV
ncbi:hypothetical protein [Dasania marina]|uniref:hypothetical protein n=1 Tax=Dasania marina TaxID=471499 RepID=UPI000370187D|nr:hypothetical protein [Dasania marina]